jgi:hypothetical protein
MCDFIFHFFIYGSVAGGGPQPSVGAICPPREPLSYVLPELFDKQTDRAYRSYHSTICGSKLGTVRFRGTGHYMSLHPAGVLSM